MTAQTPAPEETRPNRNASRSPASFITMEELYRFTMRINRQFPFVADVDGALLYIDPLWAEWSGAPLSNALGFGFLDYIHPDDRVTVAAAWKHAMAHTVGLLHNHRARMADGSYRWFRCASGKYQMPGEPLRWRGLVTDIDELCRARTAAKASEARFRTSRNG